MADCRYVANFRVPSERFQTDTAVLPSRDKPMSGPAPLAETGWVRFQVAVPALTLALREFTLPNDQTATAVVPSADNATSEPTEVSSIGVERSCRLDQVVLPALMLAARDCAIP